MITKFGSLFAGHVDLDDLGFDGTPANDRWLSDEQLATVFDKALAIAQVMDRNGYDTFWMAEHHFQREGYECIPNVLMMAVHLAHLTKNIRFGCGFNIAPMWHPLRMAEDYATADILTGGRSSSASGAATTPARSRSSARRCSTRTPTASCSRSRSRSSSSRFNERAFSHQGKHYTIPPRVPYRGYELEEITLVPRPMHCPCECWQPVVSASQRGARLHGQARHQGHHRRRRGARRRQRAGGPAPSARRAPALRSRDRAGRRPAASASRSTSPTARSRPSRRRRPFFEENMKMFAPLGFVRGLTDEQIAAVGRPEAGPPGQPADAARGDQGRLLALRPAGADHREAAGDPGQVSGSRAGQCRAGRRDAATGDRRATGAVRQGGHADHPESERTDGQGAGGRCLTVGPA